MKLNPDRLARRLEIELGGAAVTRHPDLLASRGVDGIYPSVICSPADAKEVSEALRVCRETDAAVTPWGGGTAVKLGNLPERVEVIIDLSKLNRVVEHDHANLTATVQSGITLDAMKEITAGARQFVPFDVPSPQRSTIGGIAAANLNGARRGCYGSVRDLVIGMKVALPTGERIKAGGKVVKNVAGYDMCKLFVGSLGTLGIITEVTLRMAPLPETAATLVISGALPDVSALGEQLSRSALLPARVFLLNQEANQLAAPLREEWALAFSAEGFEETVARHLSDAGTIAAKLDLGSEILRGDAHN